jgi:hypothetical protein
VLLATIGWCVTQRIGCNAEAVDCERCIAGVDCGFGTAVRAEPWHSPERWSPWRAVNRAVRDITAATGQSRSSIPQIYFAGFAWDAALK